MGRPVVHFELWSKDPEKVSNFYEDVFGWQIRPIPELNYRLIETGGEAGIDGGIMTPKEGPWTGTPALYTDVDDIEAYPEKLTAAGGTVIAWRPYGQALMVVDSMSPL